ncbi:hypothetical protein [Rhodococcus koreensis]|uniref:hypothetical protein n=1 Tax=Rhodococcus koreensis TaxID=99653 RepID=UPI00366E9803
MDEVGGGRIGGGCCGGPVADADGSPGEGRWGHSVCRKCVDLLAGIDAAAVTLRATVSAQNLLGASADWAGLLEDQQYTLGEGPGVQAFTQGHPVLIDDLTAHHQWPAFTDAAHSARWRRCSPVRCNSAPSRWAPWICIGARPARCHRSRGGGRLGRAGPSGGVAAIAERGRALREVHPHLRGDRRLEPGRRYRPLARIPGGGLRDRLPGHSGGVDDPRRSVGLNILFTEPTAFDHEQHRRAEVLTDLALLKLTHEEGVQRAGRLS